MHNIRYCVRCFMPSTRPRITMNDEGVCNACVHARNRSLIDFNSRREDLARLLNDGRRHPVYDCVVPWSGGKDSSTVALRLREEFGLHPLLVNFSPLIPTTEGEENKKALLNLGFDAIVVRPSEKVSRDLARRFFIERGDPKIHWTAGINAAPMRVATTFGIPLVFYAEHGESEYGGRVLSERHLMERDLDEVLEHQIGDDPQNWATSSINAKDLFPYEYPSSSQLRDAGTRALYFGYYFSWDVTENIEFVRRHFDFQGNQRGRTYGTFNDYDSVDDVMDDLYYFMQFIKFGFGRCLRDCARMIQRNRMDRARAANLIALFDGEMPEETLDTCLTYMNMSRSEFWSVVDQHRSSRIWESTKNGWKLRVPPPVY